MTPKRGDVVFDKLKPRDYVGKAFNVECFFDAVRI